MHTFENNQPLTMILTYPDSLLSIVRNSHASVESPYAINLATMRSCGRQSAQHQHIVVCPIQTDIDRLGSWARKWGMRFQPVKCNMVQLTRKRIKKIHASYTSEGTDLENVESVKYLGVTITSDLSWDTHVSNVYTKANRTLGFLRKNLYSCHQDVKEAAYKGLVRPVLDYGSSV